MTWYSKLDFGFVSYSGAIIIPQTLARRAKRAFIYPVISYLSDYKAGKVT